MASSQDTRLLLLLLVALLLLVDTASLCHGRRIQGVNSMALGGSEASPQAKGYSSKYASFSTVRNQPSRVYRQMHRVSKRFIFDPGGCHGTPAATSANPDELVTKQQEDHQSVLATLTSLADENQTSRAERAEDRATLKSIADTLQKLQSNLADTSQQQRAQHMAILRLEGKGTAQLGGLGLMQPPAATSKAGETMALTDPADRAPRLYKIDFPLFDGASDPRPWLTRCNLFFLGQRTQESDKTWLASYHLTDVATLWYGHLEAKLGQRPSWGEFQTLISNHFGPPTRANPFGELISTRRSGTVAEYSKRFLENLSRVHPISDAEERDIFTNNLGEPMKTQVEMLKPATLDAAMDLAISFEHLNTVTGASAAARSSRPPRSMTSPSAAVLESSGSQPALVFKKLTPAEMDDRRAKGLCFNCDEKFVRGHRCKRLFYIQSADDEEEPVTDAQEAKISLLAVTGIPTSDTMQVSICVGDRDLVALLDSGSTHNFIHEELATVVGVPFSSDRRLGVTVANGDRVTCRALLKHAAITIGKESFIVDLHAIPLGGFDVVLGTRFLKTLGPILWDFSAQWMSFWHMDHQVEWTGLGSPGRPAHVHVCDGKDLLDSLLAAFSDIFADPQGLPPPRAHDHHIHLIPGTQPVAIRPYWYPTIQKDELERQCAEMLARGLIRRSSSAFSSPVLLVRKHDGTWRFCIDYRGLNMVTIKDKFPIPVVDELLDELKGARFFTKLDLRSGYHQVRMAPEDIHKTAFRTHEGLFEFVVMAFGLTNAPVTFQALMNDVLRLFLRRFVLVFFDDIFIYSSSWSDHLRHVKLVLEAMRTHKLFLKRSKCSFGEESMAYLGHVISAEGVAMDGDKVLAVVDWPVPRTVRAVRGFLGLAGYYRKFIKGFGTIAAPPTALLKKDGFLWTDQAAAAFEALKGALTTAPVLQLPDFSVLIQWEGQPASAASWEDVTAFRDRYPGFQLEDKLFQNGGGDVMWGKMFQRRRKSAPDPSSKT
ncbi:hypothetical protein QYE76_011816 [Lolium multiflorum]|uniref:Reverse transcriptase domain-containing protein n=1 Tax=Lolium multiflorum TaxID=4521 RepID=A0AAD8X5Z5_LOLMU|nr:hypothetical protein QYE76_011816 [Lolium multiflorum]